MIEWSQYSWSISISEQVSFWHAPRQQQSLTINKTLSQGLGWELGHSHEQDSNVDSRAESELLEATDEQRDSIYFFNLICIDVHSQHCTSLFEGILGRGQKGSGRLAFFKSLKADNQDVFQSLNTHCSLELHITKRVRNCQNTNLSLTGRISYQREPESRVINVALADF